MMWAALTALSLFAIARLFVYLMVVIGHALGYLQPLLLPVAISAVLAYLLDPVVDRICRLGVSRMKAVFYVFALVFLPMTALLLWIIPQIYRESLEFAGQVPNLVATARQLVQNFIARFQERYAENQYVQQGLQQAGEWVQQQLPEIPAKIWSWLRGGLEGVLGAFGFLIGLVVVPIYLFFFLKDAAAISKQWSDYLPLRSSAFKDEVVSCLTEINSYLIAFFRGQILVTTIDGIMIGIALSILGLPFAPVIGLMVAILQLIPYIGIFICWIPAVLIAAFHWPHEWTHPLIVTIIFVVVSNLDGLFIAPRIVGKSVGLHPVTIILSVIGWSLLIGGPLGALLAVPLTATLKVLLKRYVWERSLVRRHVEVPVEAGGTVTVEIP